MKTKRITAAVISVLLIMAFAVGCGEKTSLKESQEKNGDKVVTVTFKPDGDEADIDAANLTLAKTGLEIRLDNDSVKDYTVTCDYAEKEVNVKFTVDKDLNATEIENMVFFLASKGEVYFCREENRDDVLMTGSEGIANAGSGFDDISGTYVRLDLTERGAIIIEEITGEMVGQKLSLWVDESMVSAPTVSAPITGGEMLITGLSSQYEADTLVAVIRGVLPYRLLYDGDKIEIERS